MLESRFAAGVPRTGSQRDAMKYLKADARRLRAHCEDSDA
jgi:hypothetical protein